MTRGGAREQLIALYSAAVAGANVESLTADAVAQIPLEQRRRVWLFAAGKASHGMARAAVETLERGLAEIAGGVVVAAEAEAAPRGTLRVSRGDHPIPGKHSFAAAAEIRQELARKRGADVGIVLLSGGASSLIGAPLAGMSGGDLSRLYELLLEAGLAIDEMNAIRKRFACWAAGRLALALAPARTHCLAVSDVPGDDLGTIGSGPCVPDETVVGRVVELLRRAELHGKIAPTFRRYLSDTARGVVPETPKPSHPAFAHVKARVIANNRIALNAAAAAARGVGFATTVHDRPLVGDAAAAGGAVADALLALGARSEAGSAQCLIWGGETTVALRGPAPPGGRCQELALAAAGRLAEAGDRAARITLLAAGTDGRDGTTDSAGAVVDASTWTAIAATRDPADALRKHEAHRALAAVNALIAQRATGTNVMDVVIGVNDA